jgi:hypothetical protein
MITNSTLWDKYLVFSAYKWISKDKGIMPITWNPKLFFKNFNITI